MKTAFKYLPFEDRMVCENVLSMTCQLAIDHITLVLSTGHEVFNLTLAFWPAIDELASVHETAGGIGAVAVRNVVPYIAAIETVPKTEVLR